MIFIITGWHPCPAAPEKTEYVLNFGMQFISELMDMATGQKVQASDTRDKIVSVNRLTGEVLMKFELPGF